MHNSRRLDDCLVGTRKPKGKKRRLVVAGRISPRRDAWSPVETRKGWISARLLEILELEVIEPSARGAYLKDSEQAKTHKLHKKNPEGYPFFFNWHDRKFHVATLTYKPDFKVMPEGWDGTINDPDEVLYDISMKEDEILYHNFLRELALIKWSLPNN
ncbi:hypothetical protein R6Q59_017898 [Mikania micrantha]